jgi:hypothetical protein
VEPEGGRRLGQDRDRSGRGELEIEIPIGGVPQAIGQSAYREPGVAADHRRGQGDHFLNQQGTPDRPPGLQAERERERPTADLGAVWSDELGRCDDHYGFGVERQCGADLRHPVGQPEVVLVQHGDMRRPRALHRHVGLDGPRFDVGPVFVADIQPAGITRGDLLAGGGRAGIDHDEFDPGAILPRGAVQRRGKPCFAAMDRHGHAQPAIVGSLTGVQGGVLVERIGHRNRKRPFHCHLAWRRSNTAWMLGNSR